MKFVDETKIRVLAGKGGDGCVSFRREKFVPRGGPDGGDGGDGGSVYLRADESLTTLADYRQRRVFKAASGRPGMGKERAGHAGEGLELAVPLGTRAQDMQTGELLGDLTRGGQRLLVAKGGHHGLGNTRYKSSTNRAPRQSSKGAPGEERELLLELNVLADVGLLGLPNAGKSSFLAQVSAARPRIADYPFTTLHPQLGVVAVEPHRSFTVADIPGLIEGAGEGAGLGHRFLRHLRRVGLLLHIVDTSPMDENEDPARHVNTLARELQRFDADLARKPRWLVLNKVDLLPQDAAQALRDDIVRRLRWRGPAYHISAATGAGVRQLIHDIMAYLEGQTKPLTTRP